MTWENTLVKASFNRLSKTHSLVQASEIRNSSKMSAIIQERFKLIRRLSVRGDGGEGTLGAVHSL